MQVNSVNNQTFGARIKISKNAIADFRDASIVSGLGTTASGLGGMSSIPVFDPAHHINTIGKIIDTMFAGVGGVMSVIGSGFLKISHSLFKHGVNKSKLPS